MAASIESLTPEDWELFKSLRLEMLSRSPAAFGSNFDRESGFCEQEWRDFLRAFHPIVVKFGGQIAGTAGYLRPFEEEPFRVKIVSMYVRPSFRREGLGRRLLKEIVLRIREETEAEEVTLSVYRQNRQAFELYQSAGFQVCGGASETAALEDGREELLMSMALER